MTKRATWWISLVLCAVLFPATQYMIYSTASMDRILFFNQKIFYYHVPCAFMLFVSVIVCGIYGLLHLKKRDPRYDHVAQAAGELSVIFGAIVLVTGSIWGKAAWGVWWTWDARLTTSLLLWLVMVSYVLVRNYGGPGSERLASGLAVFGMIDVPLIYFSVKIWKTLHPQTSVVPGLKSDMRIVFWLSVLLFLCFFLFLLISRIEQLRLLHRTALCRERLEDLDD